VDDDVTLQQQELEPNHFLDEVELYTRENAFLAQDSFEAFRRTVRPGLLINPFVLRITRELQHFAEAFEAGARPKLALCTPSQHGKSIAAEDFAAWMAGRNPDWKTLYASYSEDLGMRMNLNLQRVFMSRRFREVYPSFGIGDPNWVCNTNLM
jgi:hypothetical protein